jgi:hypothetical protein
LIELHTSQLFRHSIIDGPGSSQWLAALRDFQLDYVGWGSSAPTGQLRAQFAEAYEMARELNQPAAMVTATTAQAKLAGLWIERSEQTRKQPDEMSDAEIAAILRANAN